MRTRRGGPAANRDRLLSGLPRSLPAFSSETPSFDAQRFPLTPTESSGVSDLVSERPGHVPQRRAAFFPRGQNPGVYGWACARLRAKCCKYTSAKRGLFQLTRTFSEFR